MVRLSTATLSQLDRIPQPKYDREQVKAGIVHLGIGAFHRAHQAYYTEQVMNEFGGDWGILGCSLRSQTVQQQLEPQHGLYTLLVRGEQSNPQIIGAVKKVLVGPTDPSAVINAISDPQIKIVSLTITEKGYCHNPATGELNSNNADIQHDIKNLQVPKTAIGYIVAALQKRMQFEGEGLTIMSCDNLPHNGKVTRNVIIAFADMLDPVLAQWITLNVKFPSTMIDRIVPATTFDDIKQLHREHGYEDQAMVVAEPFSQWVIENNFHGARPQWEKVGALIVSDVSVYETMKLRLLNGSHSLLAYVGYLSGFQTIYQTMQDEALVALTRRFMELASQTLSMPQGFSVEQYQRQLIERFANPGLQHRTRQIAMDGSQKVPQRWLGAMRDLIQQEKNIDLFCLALAAWMRYCLGVDEHGQAIELSDPLAERLRVIAEDNQGQWQNYVRAFFSVEVIFDHDFLLNESVVHTTAQFLQEIFTNGMSETFKRFLNCQ